jgi:hypothetical protein
MLAGNVVALLSPLVFVPILTVLVQSKRYDWKSMKDINRVDDRDIAIEANIDPDLITGEAHYDPMDEAEQHARLKRSGVVARFVTVALALALLLAWPLPMYGSGYVFSKSFFTGWVAAGIIWMFCSAFCIGLYPPWEGRKTIVRTVKAIFLDATGKRLVRTAQVSAEDLEPWGTDE